MNNHFSKALQERSFLFLWLAEVFSQIAANMMNFILILVVFSLTNSSTAVSGIVLSFTIPAIVFGVLAGVMVDHWDKKKVLYTVNFIRAACSVLLALFHQDLPVVYSVSFIIAIAAMFFIPAETPIIPLVVGKELLISANALFGIAFFGSILIAYALSGPFLLALGSKWVFIILAFFYLLSAVFMMFVKTKKQKLGKQETFKDIKLTFIQEVKWAFSTVVKVKEIYHSFLLLALTQILILVIAVIGPGYAKHVLNIRIAEFPLLFVTPAAIGMVVGAVLLTNYFHKFSKQKSATIGLFISAVAVLLLPYGSQVTSKPFIQSINLFLPHILKINILHIMVVLAFIMGLANALIFVPSNTLIQEKTSDETRGKVYGALNALVALLSLFPVILAGSLADIFGVNFVLVSIGVVMIGIGFFRIVAGQAK